MALIPRVATAAMASSSLIERKGRVGGRGREESVEGGDKGAWVVGSKLPHS